MSDGEQADLKQQFDLAIKAAGLLKTFLVASFVLGGWVTAMQWQLNTDRARVDAIDEFGSKGARAKFEAQDRVFASIQQTQAGQQKAMEFLLEEVRRLRDGRK